jgi:hypothetical protein
LQEGTYNGSQNSGLGVKEQDRDVGALSLRRRMFGSDRKGASTALWCGAKTATGGYLLQASLVTAARAANGLLDWLASRDWPQRIAPKWGSQFS